MFDLHRFFRYRGSLRWAPLKAVVLVFEQDPTNLRLPILHEPKHGGHCRHGDQDG